MCHIIREFEQKIRQYEGEISDLKLSHSSKTKVMNAEIKQLQKENKMLISRAEESNSDCERLSMEYKNLLKEMSDAKFKSQEVELSKKEDRMLLKEYSGKMQRLQSKLDQFETEKKSIMEKYTLEIEEMRELYEKTITVQKDHMKIFKQKIDDEIDTYEKKLQKSSKSQKTDSKSSPPRSQIKERDRVSDLLREISVKEANLKSTKGEVRALKVQLSKQKVANKELKSKISDLREIIDSNPRTKRILEKQKGEINSSFKRYSPSKETFNPSSNANISVKEQNELLEQIITLKLEANKSKSMISQLEELNSKLKSETLYYETENTRLNKRCEKLISNEIDAKEKKMNCFKH